VTYPGGKNGAGVYQQIINRMPPHAVYIEPFLGGGAIMRLKRPAAINIGLDLDPRVIQRFGSYIAESGATRVSSKKASPAGSGSRRRRSSGTAISDRVRRSADPLDGSGDGEGSTSTSIGNGDKTRFVLECRDGIDFLRSYSFTGSELVYCDPPYMHETRTRSNQYRFELTDAQHRELLQVLASLKCKVIVSGYWTNLYSQKLKGWTTASFQTMTRGGRPATEWLWMNFAEPVALHDYRYLGCNFRERERIKRKKSRWVSRLGRMEVLERRALLAAIADIGGNGEVSG
jgi:DNA adenine methylase